LVNLAGTSPTHYAVALDFPVQAGQPQRLFTGQLWRVNNVIGTRAKTVHFASYHKVFCICENVQATEEAAVGRYLNCSVSAEARSE
jgi:hypothetical protein